MHEHTYTRSTLDLRSRKSFVRHKHIAQYHQHTCVRYALWRLWLSDFIVFGNSSFKYWENPTLHRPFLSIIYASKKKTKNLGATGTQANANWIQIKRLPITVDHSTNTQIDERFGYLLILRLVSVEFHHITMTSSDGPNTIEKKKITLSMFVVQIEFHHKKKWIDLLFVNLSRVPFSRFYAKKESWSVLEEFIAIRSDRGSCYSFFFIINKTINKTKKM